MKTVLLFKSSELSSFAAKLAGVTAGAKAHGWNIQVIEPGSRTVDVRRLREFWQPAGCIVSCGPKTNTFSSAALGSTPVVFIDRPQRSLRDGDSCIYHDSTATARVAARELLSLNLASYGYASWPVPTPWDIERLDGFREILGQHGRTVSVFRTKLPISNSDELPRSLAKWLRALPKPIGILAATDQMAVKVISACHLEKLKVPDDVSVIGIDNDERLCEASNPTLSSVEPDFAEAGRLAAETLAKLIAQKTPSGYRATYAPRQLVRRESTRRFAQSDREVSSALERIRLEACNGLSAHDVLEGFPCSRRMAELRFRAVTGKSVLEEIRAVRLAKAKELLSSSDLKLEAIANFCGYKSAVAFALFFKSETGETPSRWRARLL